jgi:hypothetical protein
MIKQWAVHWVTAVPKVPTGSHPFLADWGDLAEVEGPDPRYLQALGGGSAEHTWQRLFLSSAELVSLGVLLVIAYGWNATPVSELGLPQTMAGGGGDGTVVHRVELEKRRRHAPHRYETRNLTDSGPGSPGARSPGPSRPPPRHASPWKPPGHRAVGC